MRGWNRARRLTGSPQGGLDQKPWIVAEPSAVDLHVLDDPLDVISRLGDGDALDPVDRIDFRIARIAVVFDPFPRPARAGVVSNKSEHIRSAPASDVIAKLGRSDLRVVDDVAQQPVPVK